MSRPREQEIIFSKEAWNKIRAREDFWGILRLARVVHSLTLAQTALMTPVEYQTPRARRNRAAGFIHAGSVLFEGLQVSRGLVKHFRQLKHFQNGFGLIHSDPDVQKLETKSLKPLRDKIGFHFDQSVFARSLPELDFSEYRFASSAGWNARSTYYDVVDDALFVFLTGASTDEDHLSGLEQVMVATAALVGRYLVAANILMPPVLRTFGATMRPLVRPRAGVSDRVEG